MKKVVKGREPWNKGTKGLQVAWNKGLHTPGKPRTIESLPCSTAIRKMVLILLSIISSPSAVNPPDSER